MDGSGCDLYTNFCTKFLGPSAIGLRIPGFSFFSLNNRFYWIEYIKWNGRLRSSRTVDDIAAVVSVIQLSCHQVITLLNFKKFICVFTSTNTKIANSRSGGGRVIIENVTLFCLTVYILRVLGKSSSSSLSLSSFYCIQGMSKRTWKLTVNDYSQMQVLRRAGKLAKFAGHGGWMQRRFRLSRKSGFTNGERKREPVWERGKLADV